MNSVLKLYLKGFLYTGIGLSILLVLTDPLLGISNDWSYYLFMSFFCGVFMSLSLVSMHLYFLDSKGIKKFDDEILKPTQSSELDSALSPNQLVERLKSNRAYRSARIKIEDERVELRTGFSWKSFGERITINFRELSGGKYHYKILSRPILKTTLVDYGRSVGHIQRLREILS